MASVVLAGGALCLLPASRAWADTPCTDGTTPAVLSVVACSSPGSYTLHVASDVTSIGVDAIGAGGGGTSGGRGNELTGTAMLPTGTASVYVVVGATGLQGAFSGTGGGGSALFALDSGDSLLAKLVISGAGGGGSGGAAPAGGGDAGARGQDASTVLGGSAASGSTGGAGGAPNGSAGDDYSPLSLTVATGGAGGPAIYGSGGGGGGGYAGGGGGAGYMMFPPPTLGGGGGGSSYINTDYVSGSNSALSSGIAGGPSVAGSVTLTFNGVVAPGAPTGAVASAGDARATVTFVAPENDGGTAITGYTVTSSPGNRTGTCVHSPCRVTGLTNGTAYTFTVIATNPNGDSPVSEASNSVTPVLVIPPPTAPGAPTGLSAVSGAARLVVTFTAPGDDGGSAVSGYQATVDDGATWTTLGSGGTINGTTYSVRVRAVNVAGPGPASVSTTATAGVPNVPAAVTVTPGTSSVVVSWQAPADNGVVVTGYTVTADPGPATCTTTGALTCVLGGVAGTDYTVTVTANTADDVDSTPSGSSAAATPTEPVVTDTPPDTPLTLTTDKGDISTAEPGQDLTIIGTGFAPYSTVTITLYSDPVDLGNVVTNVNGDFTTTVTVPAGLDPGAHTFIATGVDSAGDPHALKLAITVQAAATGTTPGNGGGGATLPTTGLPIMTILLAGLAATGTGAGLFLVGRSPRRRTAA
jgi:Fibronectin type III domain